MKTKKAVEKFESSGEEHHVVSENKVSSSWQKVGPGKQRTAGQIVKVRNCSL